MFGRKRKLDDFTAEIDAHLQLEFERQRELGLSEEEARAAARRAFGNVTQAEERFYESGRWLWLDHFWQDVRYGARTLRKSPGFTTVALVTIALGIGSNAVIFSLVSAVLLRPLPIRHPEQVWAIHQGKQNDPSYSQSMSYPNYKDLRDRNQALTDMAVYRFDPMSLSHNGRNERVWGYLVSENYFDVLAVRPVLGRTFLPEDGSAPNAHPVVVLDYRTWQRRFDADTAIVGHSIMINGRSFTIVGVAPPEFTGTESVFTPEFWIPSMMQEWIEGYNGLMSRGDGQWFAFGRLKPGVTPPQAQALLNSVVQQLGKEYPGPDDGLALHLNPPGLVEPDLRNAVIAFSLALSLMVGLVLAITCTNLASLLLARGAHRRKEIAVRLAIGATRLRVTGQLLTESLLLSGLGAGLGLLLGAFLIQLTKAAVPSLDFALTLDLRMDWRVIGFVVALALLTAIAFGLFPALFASRPDLLGTLKDELTWGRRRSWLRGGLVAMQVALSSILLITAGLTVRSLQHTQALGPGFNPNHALTLSVDLGLQGYDEARGRNFYQRLLQATRALPGVESVGLIRSLPLGLEYSTTGVYPDGRPEPHANEMPSACYENISPGYFAAMGIPLLAGRDFSDVDTAKSSGVAIINETLAQQFWPGENPIGKRLRSGNTGANPLEVVGVAKNGKYQTLGELPSLIVYYPISQVYSSDAALVARTSVEPKSMIASVRSEVSKLDPNLPVYEAKTLQEHMNLPLFPLHAAAVAIGSFGLLAMILAAIGIYGLMAYSVARRTQEIGIRMALGARARDVWTMVLREGLIIVALGIACGLLGAIALSKIVASLLYGVSATDPLAFALSLLLLAAVALVACFFPARRATKVDPVAAIKCL
jgi:macrolide transport system ATP-binding/permease protein